jgi:hypothetical protein
VDSVQDSLFETVAEAAPAIQEEASDEEEFDLAAMMAKQRQQAAALHQEAFKLRQASGMCVSRVLVVYLVLLTSKAVFQHWQFRRKPRTRGI